MSKAQLDNQRPGWEAEGTGTPFTYIPDYRNKKVIVFHTPAVADTVYLDVSRKPKTPMDVATPTGVPEIPEDYHDCIIPWIKRQAFLKPDRETLNTDKSQKWESEFYRKIEQAKTKLEIPQRPRERGFAPSGMY
jgi:hypothetical protein